jgi:hypothetical protein
MFDERIRKILDAARKVFEAEARFAELVGTAECGDSLPLKTVDASCAKCAGKTGRGVRHVKGYPGKPKPESVEDGDGKERSTGCDALIVQKGMPPETFCECSKCFEEII